MKNGHFEEPIPVDLASFELPPSEQQAALAEKPVLKYSAVAAGLLAALLFFVDARYKLPGNRYLFMAIPALLALGSLGYLFWESWRDKRMQRDLISGDDNEFREEIPEGFLNEEAADAGPATSLLGRADETIELKEGTALGANRDHGYLICKADGEKRQIPVGESCIIGRDGSAAHWVQDHPGVSRCHVEVQKRQNSFVARDLGSRNGSRLNGRRMTPFKWYPLQSGDRIQILDASYTFHQDQNVGFSTMSHRINSKMAR